MSKNVINIVNFIRGIDERVNRDLSLPVREEVNLAEEFQCPVTWLLQYDALVTGPFVEMLKECRAPRQEFGIWFEVDQYLVEAAGGEWKGRMIWDYYPNVDFSFGYSQEFRMKMCDVFVDTFRERFGYTPSVMGAWAFDAFTLDYLRKKHGIIGACNCKDQYGTDSYTLWGGYMANAYYPSRFNSYMPASTSENQIDVPVFRMLGSDPLHQYDFESEDGYQLVCSLEPVYPKSGGCPAWVDWFLKENFANETLGFAYAQTGQENSFQADRIARGLHMQLEKIMPLVKKGRIELETLGETAQWFRKTYQETPATAVTSLADWRLPAEAGTWYLCKNYRLNIFQKTDGRLVIRNWMKFHDLIPEDNLVIPLTARKCRFEALPVMDEYVWGDCSMVVEAGKGRIADVHADGSETLVVLWKAEDGTETRIVCTPDQVMLTAPISLTLNCPLPYTTSMVCRNGLVDYSFRGNDYQLCAVQGTIKPTDNGWTAVPENGRLVMKLKGRVS